MKAIVKDYGGSLFLIVLGIAMIIITRNPESYSPENTDFIDGVLSEDPKEGVHDESEDYIGVWVKGYDNFYEFSSCSYNDRIAADVKQLRAGDQISFYAKKDNSSITFPWKGKKYKTYGICDASSPKVGKIIKFEQFNRCNDFQSNVVIPILSGILMLMGVFQFIRQQKDRVNKNEISSLQMGRLKNTDEIIKLRPDRLTFVLRNSYFSFFLIGFGLFFNYPFDLNDIHTIGAIMILCGLYMLFHYRLIHDKINYMIDSSGIHITKISVLFQSEMNVIRYNSIKEVIYRQAFYESGKNVGTILIDNGDTNSDGEKVYSRIIGVENYKEIARLILERADLNQ
ncbi:PH domain-containing protein [Carboxylicivirga linearis]|uniref:PH domain-containing protein n=1 Tax=Carboxylicivirga linearis TaxID=1628157 RepID=A0ABS5JWB4_9BACT|nr:PH domain-containing protein [Carboxylicivirga linearis]MBS2099205.1 PH domain-containing protein [Carboxylicivirga linearis]